MKKNIISNKGIKKIGKGIFNNKLLIANLIVLCFALAISGIAKEPNSYKEAQQLEDNGDYEKAIDAYKKLLNENESEDKEIKCKSILGLVRCYKEQKDYKKAKKYLKKLEKLNAPAKIEEEAEELGNEIDQLGKQNERIQHVGVQIVQGGVQPGDIKQSEKNLMLHFDSNEDEEDNLIVGIIGKKLMNLELEIIEIPIKEDIKVKEEELFDKLIKNKSSKFGKIILNQTKEKAPGAIIIVQNMDQSPFSVKLESEISVNETSLNSKNVIITAVFSKTEKGVLVKNLCLNLGKIEISNKNLEIIPKERILLGTYEIDNKKGYIFATLKFMEED